MSHPPARDPSFEESLQSLQEIVTDLEGGAITLDESLRRFEEGIGLLRQCYQFLETAEQRIEQLVSLDSQGNITLVPFDATSTAEKQAKPARAPRKTSRAKDAEASSPSSQTASNTATANTAPADSAASNTAAAASSTASDATPSQDSGESPGKLLF